MNKSEKKYYWLHGSCNCKKRSNYLEVKVQNVRNVDVGRRRRKAIIFPQEVSQSKVPVSSVPFGKEDRVVESKILPTSHFLEEFKDIIILLSHVHLLFHQMQQNAGRHDGT